MFLKHKPLYGARNTLLSLLVGLVITGCSSLNHDSAADGMALGEAVESSLPAGGPEEDGLGGSSAPRRAALTLFFGLCPSWIPAAERECFRPAPQVA